MLKVMSLVKTTGATSADDFRRHWRDEFFAQMRRLPVVAEHLQKAVHNHVLPADIRGDEGLTANKWAGAGSYYFDTRAAAESFLADPAYRALLARHAKLLPEVTHLLVEEVWMYNHDTSHLPIKMFAFFKRLPQLSREAALTYYRTTHADIGATVNRNRTVRYVQNHVVPGYTNPDERYNYDGGPEIWFKTMDIALDLFGDKHAMDTLAKDEANFVIRGELLHFLTDEEPLFTRDAIPAMAS
jgi:hypothetical protein